VMPNGCWLRCEVRGTKKSGEVNDQFVTQSTVFGPMRRDPQGVTSKQGGSAFGISSITCRALVDQQTEPHGASAMGKLCGVTSKRSLSRSCRMPLRSGRSVAIVAPFGVSAISRFTHTHRALESSFSHAYEVQETDGVIEASDVALIPPLGTGAPTLSFFESVARSDQRGSG